MHANGGSRPARALHVAMIFEGDADDPRTMSGMPYHMAAGLRAAGARVTPVSSTPIWTGQATHRLSPVRRLLPGRLARLATAAVRAGRDLARRARPETTRREMMDHAASQSALAAERLRELAASDPPDLVFSCSLSRLLYKLETDIPVIFYNDTTTRVVLETYPMYARAPRGYREACELMEQDAVSRTAALVFATERAREAAVVEFGYDPDRIFLAPMGANVLPEHPDQVRCPAEAPTRDNLRLCIIAADPERKRVDLCVEITERLVQRGVKARLSYIGPPRRSATRSPHVDCLGRLSLSNAADRRRHREVLEQSHIQLLPSLGEAFGIAPCESAHYARPSIVTDVGGLPTVVLHKETGFVLPLEAGADDYVAYIEQLLDDPALYERLSTAALKRARSTLNWEAWGRTLVSVMRDVVQAERGSSRREHEVGAAEARPTVATPGQ